MIEEAIKRVVEHCNLQEGDAEAAMREIMGGRCSDAQIAAFLIGLGMKGESPQEIAAFVRVMRQFATKINPSVKNAIDMCGTGGDFSGTFNISTTASFVVAGAGIPVAKHGNRATSSKCGSADILAELGVKIDVRPEITEKCIERIGIGFMFAPLYHGAMKHVAKVRKELGVRTIFNILGPLTNPSLVKRQVIGVYDAKLTEKIADALKDLEVEHAMVVNGGGIDEIAVTEATRVSELRDGKIETYDIEPGDFGIKRTPLSSIVGGDCKKNAEITNAVLNGEGGPRRDVVLLNAAAGVYVGGKAKDLAGGVQLAKDSIDSGRAIKKLEELVKFTNEHS